MKRVHYQKALLLSFSFFSALFAAPVASDVLFDYSSAISGLSSVLASHQATLDSINTRIAELEEVVGYSSVVSSALEVLNTERSALVFKISELEAVVTEITAVSNLSAEEKAQLYYFYTILGCSHDEFMVRMPFNYQAALVDPVIQALLVDAANTSNAKVAVARLVYENYPIFGDHISGLVELYPYLA